MIKSEDYHRFFYAHRERGTGCARKIDSYTRYTGREGAVSPFISNTTSRRVRVIPLTRTSRNARSTRMKAGPLPRRRRKAAPMPDPKPRGRSCQGTAVAATGFTGTTCLMTPSVSACVTPGGTYPMVH